MRGQRNKMKILSITAQKPNSTGSGVYLTELVKEYAKMGHTQAVVAGVYADDAAELPKGTAFYPVYFASEALPFPIAGMSDEMPYKSTRYCDMTEEMTKQFERVFLSVIERAVSELDPDVILCHHLYLLTAIVREHFPDRKVYGFCHNTDLRQMQKTPLKREYIRKQIYRLDRIFVPQSAQEEGVKEIFGVEDERIVTAGMGYNSQIFRPMETGDSMAELDGVLDGAGETERDAVSEKSIVIDGIEKKKVTRLVFAGKISEKKGVMSLIRSLSYLDYEKETLKLYLAGSTGNEAEYEIIQGLAKKCKYEVAFLGRLSQTELAKVYNKCDIFVLPSFFDGLPLTVIEALACRDRVVISELPGVPEWLEKSAPGADIRYVKMPEMKNTDEPVKEDLPAFERRLADALKASIETKETKVADVSGISWERIARRVLE